MDEEKFLKWLENAIKNAYSTEYIRALAHIEDLVLRGYFKASK